VKEEEEEAEEKYSHHCLFKKNANFVSKWRKSPKIALAKLTTVCTIRTNFPHKSDCGKGPFVLVARLWKENVMVPI
jgi:hypothetical protein